MQLKIGFGALLFAFLGAQAQQQFCSLSISSCLKNLGGGSGTVTVPNDAIWLDPVIPVCPEAVNVVNQTATPPSIVFIIDNSGSMNTSDRNIARFSVARQLLDTLNLLAPKSQVGLVVFSRRLSFDQRDNAYFDRAFPGHPDWFDSYVPLTRLDTTFPGNVTGHDTLKAFLRNRTDGTLVNATTRPGRPNGGTTNDPGNTRYGTDISLGFLAAKLALAKAAAAKENQYFIFISDGQPELMDSARVANRWDFMNTAGVPTTFTVFFDAPTHSVPTAPDSIAKMTEGIKANGYSLSNPKSSIVATNNPSSELAPLLLGNLRDILASYQAVAGTATLITNGGPPVTSVSVDTKNFTFPGRIALGPAQTSVDLTAKYHYVDSMNVGHDTTFSYHVNIQRGNVGTYPPNTGKLSCYDAPDIKVYSDGVAIAVVTADHDSVEVRVTLPAGEVCNGCPATTTPSKSADKETLILNPGGGYVSAILHRSTSSTPTQGNNVLEHLPTDSIVVIYTNPNNPLETVRKAFPYSDVRSTLQTGPIQPKIEKNAPSVSYPVEEKVNWIIVTNPGVKLENPTKPDIYTSITPSNPRVIDSTLPFPGVQIEASRSFKADVWVFTNFGDLVDKFSFSIPQTEFTKLPPGKKQNTRILRLLWTSKSQGGQAAGTGAYIMKYTVTLNKLPGIAEDKKVTSNVKILGYLRPSR